MSDVRAPDDVGVRTPVGIVALVAVALGMPAAVAHEMEYSFGSSIDTVPLRAGETATRLMRINGTDGSTSCSSDVDHSLQFTLRGAPWWLTLDSRAVLPITSCGPFAYEIPFTFQVAEQAPNGSTWDVQLVAMGRCDEAPCRQSEANVTIRVVTPVIDPPAAEATPTPSAPTPTPERGAPAEPVDLDERNDVNASTVDSPSPRSAARTLVWILLGAVATGGAAWGVARVRRSARSPRPAGTAQLLKKYLMDRPVGRGAFGSVWLATHAELGRKVVLKTLHPGWTRDDAALARFRREARILALIDHPNVTRIFDMEEADERLFIVMEHVEGGNLEERLRRGPLAREEVGHVLSDVLAGLAYVHARGVVHRDIKPTNMLLTRSGVAKLADFGVSHAALAAPELAASGAGGTPLYMAPEQLAGRGADERSDLFSVAVVAHECLVGELPVAARPRSLDELRAVLAAPPRIHPKLRDTAWEPWLELALARDPARRFATADEMREALPFGPG